VVVSGIKGGEEEVDDRVSDVERQLGPLYLLCAGADIVQLSLEKLDSLLKVSLVTAETPTCLTHMQEA